MVWMGAECQIMLGKIVKSEEYLLQPKLQNVKIFSQWNCSIFFMFRGQYITKIGLKLQEIQFFVQGGGTHILFKFISIWSTIQMFGQVYKCCQCIATTCKQVAQWISVGLWWLLLSLHAISQSTRSHSFSCQVGTSMHSCKQCKHKQILLQAFSGIHWSIFLTSTTVPVLRWWEKLRVIWIFQHWRISKNWS